VGPRRRLGEASTGKKLDGVLLRECVPATNLDGAEGGKEGLMLAEVVVGDVRDIVGEV